jgi:hypothetical protein
MQDSEGNEENRYPVTEPSKTKINYANKPKGPQEQPKRRNPISNQREFHENVTRHGQLKCTGDTQEFPKQ